MRLLAALPVAVLFLAPADAHAASYPSHLVFSISGPGGQRQLNSALTQFDLRKQGGGKWSLYLAAAEVDGSAVRAGKVSPTCQVASSDREEIITLYKLVLENANKPGVEIACTGSVSGGGTNTVDLQQAGHFFTISNHA